MEITLNSNIRNKSAMTEPHQNHPQDKRGSEFEHHELVRLAELEK
jgi:hypothetical protein